MGLALCAALMAATVPSLGRCQETVTATLEVHACNVAALGLYAAKLGFVQLGRRRGYYPDGGDAIIMQRAPGPLSPAPGGVK